MSRTNPYKKKRHVAERTLLVFGEGLSEEILLKHLKSLYSYNSNVWQSRLGVVRAVMP